MSSKKESQESETNITFNGNITGIGVVTGGEVHQTIIQEKKKKVLKQLSYSLGKSSNFIGREEELKEINQKLNHSNTLLINGFGGVGKSTIASRYLHTQKEQFDYYGFFEGINGFISELERTFDIERKLEDSLLDIIHKLQGLNKSKKLLVIDDVKETEKNQEQIEKILALKESGCTILLTSREQIENIAIYSLDILSLDDAKALFNSIFKMEDESLLEEIVTYLDYHAFFVEMTAKSLSVNTQRSPEKMIKMFRDGKLSQIKANKNESFNDFLNQQFSLGSLDDEDSLLLKQLSILPSIEIDFKFLTKIFGLTDEGEIEEFQDLLNFLVQKGWLISKGKSYKLHQIIKEFIWINYELKVEDIKTIILFFIQLISKGNTQSIKLLKGYILFFESIHKILNKVNILNNEIIDFFSNLGSLYFYNGLYKETIPYWTKVLELSMKNIDENYLDIPTYYQNLATAYRQMGNYKKAEQLYLTAIELDEKIFKESDSLRPFIYNELGILYTSTKEYYKSKYFLEKGLKLTEKSFGKEHPRTGRCYNGLASFYLYQNNYDKSEFYYLKSMKINENTLEQDSYSTIQTYYSLFILYVQKEMFEKAYEYIKKAFNQGLEVLDKNHPYLIDYTKGLEWIEHKLEEEKATKK